MLIVTRKAGEAIHIGDNVVVTVLAVRGNQIRIGIAAPKDVPVHREEVKARNDAQLKRRQDQRGEAY